MGAAFRLQHLMPGSILTGNEEVDYRVLRDLWSAMVGAAEAGLLAERPQVREAMEDVVAKWGVQGIYRTEDNPAG